ncbi:MAG: transcriptional regulator [Hyphomicrobiaceae bacterium]|nr:MAG: transcriptional regulator [Hyphomicrobiaceae bacterium]
MLAIAKSQKKQLPTDPRVWFTSFEALARVFSRQNMMLIMTLRQKDLGSVTELANAVGRTKADVRRSLVMLEKFEIVEFEEGEGRRKAPRLKYDDFDFRALLNSRDRRTH